MMIVVCRHNNCLMTPADCTIAMSKTWFGFLKFCFNNSIVFLNIPKRSTSSNSVAGHPPPKKKHNKLVALILNNLTHWNVGCCLQLSLRTTTYLDKLPTFILCFLFQCFVCDTLLTFYIYCQK